MAPPHRVSCLNCVKAKRRCDLAFPACHRCAVRGLVCDHPRKHTNNDAAFTLDNDMADFPIAYQDQQRSRTAQSSTFRDGSGLTLPQPTTGDTQLDFNSCWAVNDDGLDGHDSQSSLMSTILDNFVETIPRPPAPVDKSITTGAIYNERTRYAARRFKLFPHEFCKAGQTAFIHRGLYREYTPEHIQDVLGSCALYCGRNEQTETLVFGTISRKAANLVNNHITFTTPVDLLSSIQALILYQIIRLFDGDIRQRAEAEAHEAVLMSWTEQLQQRTESVLYTGSSTSPDTQAPALHKTWDGWIFEESCRRTILVAYLLQGTYSFLKFGWDDVSDSIGGLSFSAQAALWSATSEFGWKESIASVNPFQVTISQWDSHLEGAGAEDLDELGVLMMSLIKGIDLTSEWLGKDKLALWGLE